MFGAYGGNASTPAFFTPATAFSPNSPFSPTTPPAFGTPPSMFAASPSPPPPFLGSSNAMFRQPPPPFGQPNAPSLFGQNIRPSFGNPIPAFPQFNNTTQMAPIEPLPFSLPDKDIQAILNSYRHEQGNSGYCFKHLLFSVIDPSMRAKPFDVSDVMWGEAMEKIEVMDLSDQERMWPELLRGFKDLSQRLKLQDEALALDAQRLQATQKNVKLLERHFQVEIMPWIQRLRQKEQLLQRRLLRIMRTVEALEGFGLFLPSTKGEAYLEEKMGALARKFLGQGEELQRRVRSLLSICRMQDYYQGAAQLLPGLENIDNQCLGDMHEVINQQTDAISRLCTLLKKDMRNLGIMKPKETEM